MRGDQLLLLAERVDEPKRVRAEAHNRHDRKQHQRTRGARRHSHPLAHVPGCKHHEWQHQSGRGLHAHPEHDQHRGTAQSWRRTGCQQQRAREHEQHERVVVRTAHRQLERHRVQADESGRPLRRVPHLLRGPRDQCHRTKTRRHRERLQHPQAASQTERCKRVGAEREQRPIGRVLKRPPDEREHRVGGRFGGHVRVGVQPVQHAQPRKRQVAEHVLGDERRSQQQHHIHREDRREDRLARQRPGGKQHRHVARAHHKRQRLEAARAEPKPEAVQWPIQPRGPAALASRHILSRSAGRSAGHAEHAHERSQQPGDSKCSRRRRRAHCPARGAASVLRGRYAVHVAVPPEHPSPCARPSRIVRQMGKA